MRTLFVVPLLFAVVGFAACGARTDLGASADSRPDGPSECGNGLVEAGEACDDSNTSETDGCLSGCVAARCGDGVLADFEGCDDGNTVDGDGCGADCIPSRCGDGQLDPGEECDTGGVTNSCTALCREHRCGDGVVQAGIESCDAGAENADRYALAVLQGDQDPMIPHAIYESMLSYYDYSSASAHTGFEALRISRLHFTLELSGALSLVILHGDELDAQPESRVVQRYAGLPVGAGISVADDREEEFDETSPGVAEGDWRFRNNTDGGVIGGLPFPGSWVIAADTELLEGIDDWQARTLGESWRSLDPNATVYLVANDTPAACRRDCTIPSCGDGVLDAGEACDGAGCRSDCSGLE